ncbi:SRF-type transcription factor (DNA-binding and dimerization domain)-domain-containing protein [Armillaria novae-zelandiae]|uniref:SRF-type transcription factor (DNA-binding and dimerization domain)-domain-containing protein n=1 Tax=Armillaria novae-zelandiae TaxID=153914 RepID=A0AA39PPA7_9AGAR|nr:SRF-type transcription factor (DNA-binding and dimerization domain)-domain-containing protein [Armillaria novae-zelandiae]
MDMAAPQNDPQQAPPVGPPAVSDDAFINDQDAVDSAGDDDEDEDKPKSDKKAGRRKIKIEFIQDKSRRHITFSKRKAGIMKKAYELSTLTGTQVLLLVVSETGLVYTFTTAKLQPLVTQPEGKNLIQACLNAPHGTLPSSMPVGTPLGRQSGGPPMNMPPPAAGSSNLPGGLAISGQAGPKEDDDGGHDDDEAAHGGRPNSGDKRRRRASSNAGAPSAPPRSGGGTSPHSPNSTIPPSLSIPPGASSQPPPQSPQQQPQIPLGSPTSPNQSHAQVPPSTGQYGQGPYGHHHPGQGDMYPPHMMPAYGYPAPPGSGGPPGGQLGALANTAAAQQGHWQQQQQQQQQVGQSSHYARR